MDWTMLMKKIMGGSHKKIAKERGGGGVSLLVNDGTPVNTNTLC